MTLDDEIASYLDTLFGHSTPGQIAHQMLIAFTEPGNHQNALGMLDPAQLKLEMAAIAPDASVDTDQFIAKSILTGVTELWLENNVIHFVGVTVEALHVGLEGLDEAAKAEVRRLQAEGRLFEHPAAAEVTRLYAASRDGRRWVGRHNLTGPKAGTIDGPTELRGELYPFKERGVWQSVIRAAVDPERGTGSSVLGPPLSPNE